jgi:hypothetical protein
MLLVSITVLHVNHPCVVFEKLAAVFGDFNGNPIGVFDVVLAKLFENESQAGNPPLSLFGRLARVRST